MKAIMSSCWLFMFKHKAGGLITAFRSRYAFDTAKTLFVFQNACKMYAGRS
jgi:hypothetical protein